MKDPLFFHRRDYAAKLINSLKDGITHAFTLFAPRRMGKTEFLIRDIVPLAEQQGFNVFYFSFMDSENPAADFQTALTRFAADIQTGGKAKTLISTISKIDIIGVALERETASAPQYRLSELIGAIAADNRPSLLLLDEVQELARGRDNAQLIKSLRTGLDINKDRIKTIFTGSSTNGLRAMFNDHKAPFFHFAHALDFPLLDRAFTDFLADIYHERTGNSLDHTALYNLFERMKHTPMYMRATIQDMILNPALSLDEAAAARLAQMHENSNHPAQWRDLSAMERLILQEAAKGNTALYSSSTRAALAKKAGIDSLNTSTIQGNIRKLERKELLTKSNGQWAINSPLFQAWILEQTD
ncbi:selenocysteine synthase [Bergeriella denitrificans]|uniref:Putative DNA-binding protein n=1 Tax=Bergeriella denitrificans TaxID=494 RepID=A0A378UJK2_BERDE|nr:selenocysteine synthase [Bergeriella denitrificans]STZ76849.1 putative DNA-binding protein [Bergeriella denitrificans]